MKNYIYYPVRFGICFSGGNFFKALYLSIKNVFCLVYWNTFGEKEFKFTLNFTSRKFNYYVNEVIDLHVLGEVFLDKNYDYDFGLNPKIMLDIGANIGASCIYFKLKYPNLVIYALESNINLNKKFYKNTSSFGGIFLYNIAITNKNGPVYLTMGKNHLSTKISNTKSEPNNNIVSGYSISNFMDYLKLERVDIIKCDAEGAEEYILGYSSLSNICKFFVGEIHPELININNLYNYNIDVNSIPKQKRSMYFKVF
jgi:FkbM family methyltransferase